MFMSAEVWQVWGQKVSGVSGHGGEKIWSSVHSEGEWWHGPRTTAPACRGGAVGGYGDRLHRLHGTSLDFSMTYLTIRPSISQQDAQPYRPHQNRCLGDTDRKVHLVWFRIVWCYGDRLLLLYGTSCYSTAQSYCVTILLCNDISMLAVCGPCCGAHVHT